MASSLIILCCIASFQGLTLNAEAGYRGPFEGRVIGQDTLEPIEGAVVFVQWHSYSIFMLFAPHAVSEFYDASETLTNANGHFFIPKKWSWNPWTNFSMDSMFTVFKSEYGHIKTHWYPLKEAVAILKNLPEDFRNEPGAGCEKAIGDVALILECTSQDKSTDLNSKITLKDGLPIFILLKLKTDEDRWRNLPEIGVSPTNKIPLLIQEINKERGFLDRREITD